jgi:site-specific DNA-cytosine methylase
VSRYHRGLGGSLSDPYVVAGALCASDGGPDDNAARAHHLVPEPDADVRRLTPRECERLQGFPDDWTAVTWRGKLASDRRRYAALGDAVTVPVAEWLGQRLYVAASQARSFAARERRVG